MLNREPMRRSGSDIVWLSITAPLFLQPEKEKEIEAEVTVKQFEFVKQYRSFSNRRKRRR
jgi:hypothetical protein